MFNQSLKIRYIRYIHVNIFNATLLTLCNTMTSWPPRPTDITNNPFNTFLWALFNFSPHNTALKASANRTLIKTLPMRKYSSSYDKHNAFAPTPLTLKCLGCLGLFQQACLRWHLSACFSSTQHKLISLNIGRHLVAKSFIHLTNDSWLEFCTWNNSCCCGMCKFKLWSIQWNER